MVVILKNRPALERDRLQERTEPLKGRRRKSSQQAVLDPNRLFAVGTAQRIFQRYPMELSSRCVPTRPCSAGIRASSPPSYSLFDRESPASRQSGDAGQGSPLPLRDRGDPGAERLPGGRIASNPRCLPIHD